MPEPRSPRRRLTRHLALPLVSGKTSAAALVACLALAAVLVPVALRRPAWIEAELVLAVWWAVWAAALSAILYSGRRIADDHRLGAPRRWFSGWCGPADAADVRSGLTLEGCAFGLLAVLALIALLGAAWVVVEVVLPFVWLLLYTLAHAMLARVANDRHGCAGRLGPSVLRGGLWATAYTAPLALAVWLAHRLASRPA